MRIQTTNDHGAEIVPCLSLVMTIEEEFGPINKIIETIRKKNMAFETIVQIFKAIGLQGGAAWTAQEIEDTIRQHGTHHITGQVTQVLSACMIGEAAVAELFEELPGLGKP